MVKKYLFFISVLILFTWSHAQRYVDFSITQPAILEVNAGQDIFIPLGNSGYIGGAPTASGGSPPYIYCWSPSVYLDDSTAANPMVTPYSTLQYNLSVNDSRNCSSSDAVIVVVDSAFVSAPSPDVSHPKPVVFYSSSGRKIIIHGGHQSETTVRVCLCNLNGHILYDSSHQLGKGGALAIPAEGLPEMVILRLSAGNFLWTYKLSIR